MTTLEALNNLRKVYPMLYYFNVHRNHKNIPLTLQKHYYQRQIYKDSNRQIVIKKSTQNGISEYLIIYAISKASSGLNVFYILPTIDQRNRFVAGRFDKSVAFTPEYLKMVKNNTDNRGLKSFGEGIINFVGSNAETMFTEFQADVIITDELDQANQGNLAMAVERQSASIDKFSVKVSNPTVPNYGIDFDFNTTDQKHWAIKHDCGNWIELDFFKNIVEKIDNDYILRDSDYEWTNERDINIICEHCHKPINRFSDGEWIPHNVSDISGYHLSKLFSGTVSVREIVERFNDGLVNNRKMERFYNGDLGLAFTSEGAKVTEQMLDDAILDYNPETESREPCIIGIDVGVVFNVVIGKVVSNSIHIISILELRTEAELLELFKRYRIVSGVIDSMPELRLSKRLVANIQGMFMCTFGGTKDSIDLKLKRVTVDRTSSMDGVKELLLTDVIKLPKNARSINKFYSQMTAPVRMYDETREAYIWTEGNSADHYYLALTYLTLARKLLIMRA